MSAFRFDTHNRAESGPGETMLEPSTPAAHEAGALDLSHAPIESALRLIELRLNHRIAETKVEILKWIVGIIAGAAIVVNTLVSIGAVYFAVKLIGH